MTVKIITGDCRDVLTALPERSFHTCVTSPPYFGLRDYGTAQWEGGDAACDHRSARLKADRNENRPALGDSYATNASQLKAHGSRSICEKCGATKTDRQIGLEATPDAFVAEMVAVFREVRRVLRDDGTVWLNLGDSYAAARGGTHQLAETLAGGSGGKMANGERVNRGRFDGKNPTRNAPAIGLKHKDLIGIPWRVAFALQADGWYLRQDIIWHKPNPMPESVRDRCTKSHEYLFLLSKSPRYYYDQGAIAEPLAESSVSRLSQKIDGQKGSDRVLGKTNGTMKAVSGTYSEGSGRNDGNPHPSGGCVTGAGLRNRRSVWNITTKPFKEAHFATFPPDLVEPCILAGCPIGGDVLDPFGGAGTTGLVADRLQRNATLIELNPEYVRIAERRTGLAPQNNAPNTDPTPETARTIRQDDKQLSAWNEMITGLWD